MNINAADRNRPVVSLVTRRRRIVSGDLPREEKYLPLKPGTVGVVTSVDSHGSAPYTRYTVKWADGTHSVEAVPGADFRFTA